jgi:UDP-N-acetylglucosamine--N-acetylmuramyl-(pentapeptide) pyrophosphoryl-undecaprenol N-acetylglucosamine transferase
VSGLPAQTRARACGALAGAPRPSRAARSSAGAPDVVLGGGGYVAGPMVLAARLRGIPAALTEADAHLGLANRLAAPFARASSSPTTSRAGRREVPRRRAARPAAHSASTGRGAPPLRPAADGPVLAFFGALAGARSSTSFAVEDLRRGRPGRAAPLRRARLRAAAHAVTRPDYVLPASTDVRRALAAPTSRLARRRDGLGARRGRAPRRPRSLPARDRRPPDAERAALRARRRRRRRADDELARACRALVDAARRPDRLGAMSAAMRVAARPHAADEIADELIALARA